MLVTGWSPIIHIGFLHFFSLPFLLWLDNFKWLIFKFTDSVFNLIKSIWHTWSLLHFFKPHSLYFFSSRICLVLLTISVSLLNFSFLFLCCFHDFVVYMCSLITHQVSLKQLSLNSMAIHRSPVLCGLLPDNYSAPFGGVKFPCFFPCFL